MAGYRYVALTWGIPRDYGGMTRVLLDRAGLMADQLGQQVPLITLEGDVDVAALSDRLSGSGVLGSQVRLRNPWFELARMSEEELAGFVSLTPLARRRSGSQAASPTAGGSPAAPAPTAETSAPTPVDHLRPDGSVFLRDERRLGSDRGLVLVDHRGRDAARWSQPRDFYFSWIDYVIGADPSVIVSDSKYVGSFLHHYRRPHVRIVQVLHSAHRERTATSPLGPFDPAKSEILLHHDRFDAIAFLTRRQATDFAEAFRCQPRTLVIPNRIELPSHDLDVTCFRPPGQGMVAARLTRLKQVEHAIRAVGQVAAEGDVPVELDIYGSGTQHARLTQVIDESALSGVVRLRGYEPEVSTRFETASFMLLTSQSEGQGLVLGEAMSRGCVPIAYAVDYGPSELITHEVDGLLVPPDDIDGLAAAIRRFVTMDEAERVRMRLAAVLNAQAFGRDTITGLWSEACTMVAKQPSDWVRVGTGALVDAIAVEAREGEPTMLLHGAVRALPADRGRPLRLFCASRDRCSAFDLPVSVESGVDGTRFRVEAPLGHLPVADGRVYDFWIAAHGPGPRLRVALPEDIWLPSIPLGPVALTAYETVNGNLSVRCERAGHG